MSAFDIKNLILQKIGGCILQLPRDIYVLHFLIHVDEERKDIPTLSLCFNTLSELTNGEIDFSEECWNVACWKTDEIPIIGNNFRITAEALETTKMLTEWFAVNDCDYSKIEKDPLDEYYEYTTGYRVLSEMIQSITPEVKTMLRNINGFNVICLVGDFSFVPSDIERINSMNGDEIMPFVRYYQECSAVSNCHNIESGDFIHDFVQGAIEALEKIKVDYASEQDKSDQLSKAIEDFKNLL